MHSKISHLLLTVVNRFMKTKCDAIKLRPPWCSFLAHLVADDRLRGLSPFHVHLPGLGWHARRTLPTSVLVVHQATFDADGRRRRLLGGRRSTEWRCGWTGDVTRRGVGGRCARVAVTAVRSRRETTWTHGKTAQLGRLRCTAQSAP